MRKISYGIIDSEGTLKLEGYKTERDAREFCDSLNAKREGFRVVEITTVVEYCEV